MKRVQKIADEFFRKQGIQRLPLDFPVLKEIIRKNGWELLSYAEAELVIRHLELEKFRYTCQGFTYQSKDGTLIFVQDDLGYLEKIRVICHEIGHIVLLHTSYGILGKSQCPATENIQEAEADVFALELQAPGFMLYREHLDCAQKIVDAGILEPEDAKKQYRAYLDYVHTHQSASRGRQIRAYLGAGLVSFWAAAAGMYLWSVLWNGQKQPASVPQPTPAPVVQTQSPAPTEPPLAQPSALPAADTVYVTASGRKYHRPGCWHIKNRETTPLPAPDAQALGYTPCKDCQP